MSKYKVLIVPSSEDEPLYSELSTFEEAHLQGYKDTIGYSGEDFYFTNKL